MQGPNKTIQKIIEPDRVSLKNIMVQKYNELSRRSG